MPRSAKIVKGHRYQIGRFAGAWYVADLDRNRFVYGPFLRRETAEARLQKIVHMSRRNPRGIPKSYYVRLLAGKGLLLGGVKTYVSSRFEKYTDARDLMETSRKANIEADRDVLSSQVIGSNKKPEILHSQVIGTRNPQWLPPFAQRKRKRLGDLYRKAFTKFSKENPKQRVRRGVLIYGRVLKIFARKTQGPYKGQEFVHEFEPGAIMVGMSDGSIRISHP